MNLLPPEPVVPGGQSVNAEDRAALLHSQKGDNVNTTTSDDVSILSDLAHVLKTSWLAATFAGLLSGILATIVLMKDADPRSGAHITVGGRPPLGWHDAHAHAKTVLARGLRHIPDYEEQERLQSVWLNSGTTLKLPSGEDVQLRALLAAGPSRELPSFFYDSVHYGITGANPGIKQNTEAENREANNHLLQDLNRMKPKPSMIFESVSYHNVSDWVEEGFVVQFSFDDLRKQGYQGLADRNGTLWTPATDSILRLGRKYSQWAVFLWFPYQWGVPPPNSRRRLSTSIATTTQEGSAADAAHHQEEIDSDDDRLHKNILQVVLPTRTGFDKIKSSAVVWRVN